MEIKNKNKNKITIGILVSSIISYLSLIWWELFSKSLQHMLKIWKQSNNCGFSFLNPHLELEWSHDHLCQKLWTPRGFLPQCHCHVSPWFRLLYIINVDILNHEIMYLPGLNRSYTQYTIRNTRWLVLNESVNIFSAMSREI